MSWYDEVYDESKEHDIQSRDNRDVIITALADRLKQMEIDAYNSRTTYYAVMRDNDILKGKLKKLKGSDESSDDKIASLEDANGMLANEMGKMTTRIDDLVQANKNLIKLNAKLSDDLVNDSFKNNDDGKI